MRSPNRVSPTIWSTSAQTWSSSAKFGRDRSNNGQSRSKQSGRSLSKFGRRRPIVCRFRAKDIEHMWQESANIWHLWATSGPNSRNVCRGRPPERREAAPLPCSQDAAQRDAAAEATNGLPGARGGGAVEAALALARRAAKRPPFRAALGWWRVPGRRRGNTSARRPARADGGHKCRRPLGRRRPRRNDRRGRRCRRPNGRRHLFGYHQRAPGSERLSGSLESQRRISAPRSALAPRCGGKTLSHWSDDSASARNSRFPGFDGPAGCSVGCSGRRGRAEPHAARATTAAGRSYLTRWAGRSVGRPSGRSEEANDQAEVRTDAAHGTTVAIAA